MLLQTFPWIFLNSDRFITNFHDFPSFLMTFPKHPLFSRFLKFYRLCTNPVLNNLHLVDLRWPLSILVHEFKVLSKCCSCNIIFILKYFPLVNTFSLTVVFDKINPLSTIPIKWSNTLKQFVGKLSTNCLSVFDHFVGLDIFMRHFNHTEFVTEKLHQTLTSFCISFLRIFFFSKTMLTFLDSGSNNPWQTDKKNMLLGLGGEKIFSET